MNIGKPRRSETRSRDTARAISSSESPALSCSAFPTRLRDADLFVDKGAANGAALVAALRDLEFRLDESQAEDIRRGKDFVQLKNGPFDLDLVFAPDGIERFEDAWARRVEIEGFPVCHIDDIIESKQASGRAKDLESLPRLRSFARYWKEQRGE